MTGVQTCALPIFKSKTGAAPTSCRCSHVCSLNSAGFCLDFGVHFSSTISTGLFLGLSRDRAENFSFALAVALTPAVVAKEGYRFMKAYSAPTSHAGPLADLLLPDILGLVFSFAAGLIALRWLSQWLEADRWDVFGYYCLFAAGMVFIVG